MIRTPRKVDPTPRRRALLCRSMHAPRRWVWAAFCLAAATAWGATARAGEAITLFGTTMGTSYHIKLVVGDEGVDVDELKQQLQQVFDEINEQMSTYRPDSEISRFNRAPGGEWFEVSPATAIVAETALDMSRKTNGALDVTVAPLVSLWHFGAPASGASDQTPYRLVPPTEHAINEARASVGYEKLSVRRNPPSLKKEIDALSIDLSTIAGGYVVDRVAEMLDNHPIENYMVEVGGEIRTRGHRADGKRWRLAIERPVRNRREIYTTIELGDGALSTSGDYRNYFEYEGRIYSHIINPQTGWPVERQLGSVSVVADDCTTADAWDTALLILGPERGFDCAEEHNIAALFLPPEGIEREPRLTSAWRERFE